MMENCNQFQPLSALTIGKEPNVSTAKQKWCAQRQTGRGSFPLPRIITPPTCRSCGSYRDFYLTSVTEQ
jgi:hypothetical protein